MKELSIEYVPITELKEYENNAKLHTEEQIEQIAKSIKEFGFNDPIAVWKNNEVIAGHGRLKASKLLKLKKVPIIRLDKLTEEQRRAYMLAHNQLTLNTGYDIDILETELDSITSYDMTDFGFVEFEDVEAPERDYYGDERERTYNAYNLNDYDATRVAGKYDFPIIGPCNVIPDDLIGFNYVLSSQDFEKGVHFYIDDYQFERLWNEPEFYIEKMRPFQCVLTPDFSLYLDMPMAMKIWNTYRSRLIGQMCQNAGLDVIPTVSWAERETFSWCFDGLPKKATLSVSTVGVKQDKESTKIWKDGMDAMIEALKPKRLLLYGGAVDYDYGKIEVVEYKNQVTDSWKTNRHGI